MSEKRKTVVSIASGCFNEEENLPLFYRRCRAAVEDLGEDYDYEFVVADNASTDGSRRVLRELAAKDPKFKVILNAGNYGHIRSPFNAFLNASGDAVFYICSDLQEPPELLKDFVREYEKGNKVVCGVRRCGADGFLLRNARRFYYYLIGKCSETPQLPGFTGFGLYDRGFVEAVKKYHDPYPYFRGLVGEIGMKRSEVEYVQAPRIHGKTKNNFFTLYDMAMTGFVNHTKLPLRLAVFAGLLLAGLSLLAALGYLIAKLLFWDEFSLGLAPLVVGLFFFSAIQLIFIGVIGEYLGAVWTQVKDKPLVIEEERINFDR